MNLTVGLVLFLICLTSMNLLGDSDGATSLLLGLLGGASFVGSVYYLNQWRLE